MEKKRPWHDDLYIPFCSLCIFIYCLKMQTRSLTLSCLIPVSPIFSFYTMRISIDEIFAFWRDEYKHLINASWVWAYAWPSSIIIIVLNTKRRNSCATHCWEWFFFSLSLVYHPQKDESNCTRKKRCVMNTTVPEFAYIHIYSIVVNDWWIYQHTFFFKFKFSFFIVSDHEAERWLLILSSKYNKRWTIRIHHHILCFYQNQISMYFSILRFILLELI